MILSSLCRSQMNLFTDTYKKENDNSWVAFFEKLCVESHVKHEWSTIDCMGSERRTEMQSWSLCGHPNLLMWTRNYESLCVHEWCSAAVCAYKPSEQSQLWIICCFNLVMLVNFCEIELIHKFIKFRSVGMEELFITQSSCC